MDRIEQTPELRGAPHTVLEHFDHTYLRVRKALAEALSRATSDAEQRVWQARIIRVKRLRDLLDRDDSSEVLEAIAALHAEREAVNVHVAAQLASADARTHR